METLKIDINNQRKVAAIIDEFKAEYGNLTLHFYAKPHTHDGAHSDKVVKPESSTLSDCRTNHEEGTLLINPEMTVDNLEATFRDNYGLKVEIFKKTKKDWEPVKYPTKLSLQEQNQLDQ